MTSTRQVFITRRAERDIQDLDAATRKRIRKVLAEMEGDRPLLARKLVRSEIGGYRIRVGDWRIVFDMEGRDVVVLRVGNRREIYKR